VQFHHNQLSVQLANSIDFGQLSKNNFIILLFSTT
jgi:hypothetical protein